MCTLLFKISHESLNKLLNPKSNRNSIIYLFNINANYYMQLKFLN